MPITMEKTLAHMAWANQKVYQACGTLPTEALESYIVNPEWNVAKMLQHIVSGADWFVFCLGIADWNDVPTPTSSSEISELAILLKKLDAQIFSTFLLEDELLTFQENNREIKVPRSLLLSQAVHHATEHRAQLIDALESRGYSAVNLDSIDLWGYEYSLNSASALIEEGA